MERELAAPLIKEKRKNVLNDYGFFLLSRGRNGLGLAATIEFIEQQLLVIHIDCLIQFRANISSLRVYEKRKMPHGREIPYYHLDTLNVIERLPQVNSNGIFFLPDGDEYLEYEASRALYGTGESHDWIQKCALSRVRLSLACTADKRHVVFGFNVADIRAMLDREERSLANGLTDKQSLLRVLRVSRKTLHRRRSKAELHRDFGHGTVRGASLVVKGFRFTAVQEWLKDERGITMHRPPKGWMVAEDLARYFKTSPRTVRRVIDKHLDVLSCERGLDGTGRAHDFFRVAEIQPLLRPIPESYELGQLDGHTIYLLQGISYASQRSCIKLSGLPWHAGLRYMEELKNSLDMKTVRIQSRTIKVWPLNDTLNRLKQIHSQVVSHVR